MISEPEVNKNYDSFESVEMKGTESRSPDVRTALLVFPYFARITPYSLTPFLSILFDLVRI